METIKAYTNLSQSKTLSKILPLKSADMFYIAGRGEPIFIGNKMVACGEDDYDCLGGPDVLCWSLAALLNMIPNYKLSSEHNYHTCTAETSFGKETVAWFDNPVDACVAMIERLYKLNLL